MEENDEKENSVEVLEARTFFYKDTGELYIALSKGETVTAEAIPAEVFVDIDEAGDVIGVSMIPLLGVDSLIAKRPVWGKVDDGYRLDDWSQYV